MAAIIVNLECMTNMHVGNGDVNYNIIDNEVEKDPVTGYPTINASGVKGALREFFNGDSELRQYVSTLFGADKAGDTTPGQLKVLCADMIARAARASSGKQAYYLITTQTALDKYCNNCEIFLGKPVVYEKKSADESEAAEGFRLEEKVELNGKTLYILPEETFKKIELPVLARNKLDNGISKNLWYEQVVPHESLFAFAVLGTAENLAIFKKAVDGKVVQFGGNASIGYGLCKVAVKEA